MRLIWQYFLRAALIWLLAISAAFAQAEDDKGFLVRKLQEALSDAGRDVKIDGFRGVLSSEAAFDQMTIADDKGVWLTLDGAALVWDRSALFSGQLEVQRLSAQKLTITRLPKTEGSAVPQAEAQPFELPDLPVSVNVANFAVNQIVLGKSILGEPLKLKVTANASLTDEAGAVDFLAQRTDSKDGKFSIDAKYERASGQLTLNLEAAEEANGLAARMLNLPGRPSVALRVAGQGPLDDFTSDITLATDGQSRLAGQVVLGAKGGGASPDRTLRADLGGDVTALFAPDYRAFFGEDVRLQLEALRRADGSMQVDDFTLATQAANLKGQVLINQEGWPSFINITGRIAHQDSTRVLLPVAGGQTYVDHVDLAVRYDVKQGEAFDAQFNIAAFETGNLSIDAVQLGLDGTLRGNLGSVGQFLGDMTFTARGLGVADAASAQALGRDITGKAVVNYIEGQPLRVENLDLAGEDYNLTGKVAINGLAKGFLTRLNGRLEATDISRFSALVGQDIAGQTALSLKGAITPLSGAFDLTADGEARDLSLGMPQVDRLLVGQTTLVAEAVRDETGTTLRDFRIGNAALDVTGQASLSSGNSRAVMQGQLNDIAKVLPQYSGPVQFNAVATQNNSQVWQLNADMAAPYGATLAVQGPVAPNLSLDFSAALPDSRKYVPQLSGPLNAKGNLQQGDKGLIVDIAASGPLNAKATVAGLATGPDARMRFALAMPNIGVLVEEISGPLQMNGSVRRMGADWRIDSDGWGPAGTRAIVGGVIKPDGRVDLGVKGSAPLGLSRPFIAPRNLQGTARFNLQMQGQPGLAALSGRIETSDARLSAPNLRVALRDISGRVQLGGSRAQISAQGSAVAGGRVSLSGDMSLQPPLPADIQINLRDIALSDPSLYRTSIGGDLRLTGPLSGGARVAGQIVVGETYVTVPSTGLTNIGDIPLITHVAPPPGVQATRRRAGLIGNGSGAGLAQTTSGSGGYDLDIQVGTPNRIFVRGRGLDAELGGGLRVTGSTRRMISAGQFELIRGRLDILGKRFDLVEGAIQFQGDLIPYINFVSATDTATGEVRVVVKGPADAPEVSFEATPAAPQDEVLAQLLFGRNISEISALQALQLANAVAVLAGRGGEGVIAKLRGGFGLDDLDVTTTQDGTTAVRAGKYISDNVYSDVTAASDGTGEVSLNLDLSPNLTAKGSLGTDGESSLGLFYEKDY